MGGGVVGRIPRKHMALSSAVVNPSTPVPLLAQVTAAVAGLPSFLAILLVVRFPLSPPQLSPSSRKSTWLPEDVPSFLDPPCSTALF